VAVQARATAVTTKLSDFSHMGFVLTVGLTHKGYQKAGFIAGTKFGKGCGTGRPSLKLRKEVQLGYTFTVGAVLLTRFTKLRNELVVAAVTHL
jgi:hypothetical protein